MNFKELEDKAMQLSEEDRAKVAQKLLLSFAALSDAEMAARLLYHQF